MINSSLMLRERIVINIAKILRNLPPFRGKHRLGKILERVLIRRNSWNIQEHMVRLRNDYDMLIDPRSSTHNGVFWTGRYDDDIIKLFSMLFNSSWIVLDVGANIGYYTVPFAKRLYELGGTVYAFEPVSSNFNALNRNIKINKLSNAIVLKIALGNEIGEIELSITEKGHTSNAHIIAGDFLSNVQLDRSEKAEMTRLDDIYKKRNIQRCDFIKIDIEGAEIFFVQGAMETITRFLPIIYGEFSNYFLKRFGYSFLDVWKLLEPLGYTCYLQINKPPYFRKAIPTDSSENLLLLPGGKTGFNFTKIKELID